MAEKIVKEVEDDGLKVYEVVSAALTMRVGKLANEVRRFDRGALLRLDAASDLTKRLLRQASIVVHNPDKKAPRLTPAIMAKVSGADADPIAASLPVAASPTEAAEAQ